MTTRKLGGVVVAGIIQGTIANGRWYRRVFEHGLRLGSSNASQTVRDKVCAVADHSNKDI